jgi:glycosyltransferase involved in cell wall biosynthesis
MVVNTGHQNMHIVYDYQIFALQALGGISRYVLELAQRLPSFSPDFTTTILAPLHINLSLEQSPVHKIGRRIAPFPGKHHILPSINRIAGHRILRKLHPDLVHETYYSSASQSTQVPHVLTVYDMIHERYPDQFTGVDRVIPQVKARAVAMADHLIVISGNTRDDLVEYLHVAPEKITVIPLASSLLKPGEGQMGEIRTKPYLLYVGLRNGVKNFQTLLAAFSHSSVLRADYDLLCVGGGTFTPVEMALIKEMGVTEQVQHRSVDDTLLATLYAQAALFVYPSLYEGFGLPILEAMHCGCPVVCSNTSSMPEIAGDAALYFNPHDEEEMRVVMESVVRSITKTAELRTRGYARESMFSWENCVAHTAEVYQNMLGRTKGF